MRFWWGLLAGFLLTAPLFYFRLERAIDEAISVAALLLGASIAAALLVALFLGFRQWIVQKLFGPIHDTFDVLQSAAAEAESGNYINAVKESEHLVRSSIAFFGFAITLRTLVTLTILVFGTFVGSITLVVGFDQLQALKDQNLELGRQNDLLSTDIEQNRTAESRRRATELSVILYDEKVDHVAKSSALREFLTNTGGDVNSRVINRIELSDGRLEGLNFDHAWMEEVKFEGRPLSRSSFKGAIANDSHFIKSNLFETDFRGTMLHRANFRESILANADFSSSGSEELLLETFFGGANLRGVDFSDAILSHVTMSRTSLSSYQSVPDTNCSEVRRATLAMSFGVQSGSSTSEEAPINDASLRNAVIWHTKLAGTNLNKTDLSASKITGSSFFRASANEAIFSGSEISYGRFACAKLEAAEFKDSTIENSEFRRASLISSDFSSATIRALDFSGADLRCADFTNITVPEVGNSVADYINVSDSNLKGAVGLSENLLKQFCSNGNTILPRELAGIELRQCEEITLIQGCEACADRPYKPSKEDNRSAKDCDKCVDCNSWPLNHVFASSHWAVTENLRSMSHLRDITDGE